jgi:cobyrinic acid a,c-diamide synthase
LFPERPVPRRAVLAVARDRAFDFYYQDSLDLLAAWGAQLVDFSPLEDGALPDGCGGVYLGGGFPEVFAADLAANTPMLSSVRTAAGAGMPIYAECGGLMYLGRTLTDLDGRRHNMTGVLPFDSLMAQRRTSLGYRSAVAVRDSVLMAAGSEVTGHEFHYSRLGERVAEKTAAYRFPDHANALEGYAAGSILASYLHLHFGSQPGLAERLVRRVGQAPTISAG